MRFSKLLITGGAGFVGSSLAIAFRQQFPDLNVCAADSLKRRGSELNLPRLAQAGVRFVHADIRCPEDLEQLDDFELLIDCSAEPSVQTGLDGSPAYVIQTNLTGTFHCLELARRRNAAFLFLSTSRVYPIPAIEKLPFRETPNRFVWEAAAMAGFSEHGIAEEFPLDGPRSFYGASKLAGELLIAEYVHAYGMPALINRCGVLTGPWQMGKVDQGVVTLWAARHFFGRPLRYIGYGGTGKQVRDLLHVDDLFELIVKQCERPEAWDGRVYNVGGGNAVSVSLRELTDICREVTGNSVPIEPVAQTSPVDVRIFVTDARKAQSDYGWQPKRDPRRIVADIHAWLTAHAEQLAPILA